MKKTYNAPNVRIWDFKVETFLDIKSIKVQSDVNATEDSYAKDRNLPIINMDSDDDW